MTTTQPAIQQQAEAAAREVTQSLVGAHFLDERESVCAIILKHFAPLEAALVEAQESLTAAYFCGVHSKTCFHHTDKDRQQDPGCVVCLINERNEYKRLLCDESKAVIENLVKERDEARREVEIERGINQANAGARGEIEMIAADNQRLRACLNEIHATDMAAVEECKTLGIEPDMTLVNKVSQVLSTPPPQSETPALKESKL